MGLVGARLPPVCWVVVLDGLAGAAGFIAGTVAGAGLTGICSLPVAGSGTAATVTAAAGGTSSERPARSFAFDLMPLRSANVSVDTP